MSHPEDNSPVQRAFLADFASQRASATTALAHNCGTACCCCGTACCCDIGLMRFAMGAQLFGISMAIALHLALALPTAAAANLGPTETPAVAASSGSFLLDLENLQAQRGPKGRGKMSEADQARQIDHLRRLAGQYEKLIVEYKSDPRVSVAMYELAGIYASMRDQESRPVGNSREAAIKWYRRAIEVDKGKSKLSLDARLGLAQQLQANDGDPGALREARALSESVAQGAKGNPDLLAKTQSQLVRQCLKEKEYEKAEAICRELLGWKVDAKSGLVQTSQRSAATSLMQGMVYREGQSADEKQAWLDQFAKQADQLPWLMPQIELANRQLSAFRSMNPARVPLESKSSAYRTFFLATNVLVFVVVTGLLLRKLMTNRRSTEAPV